MSASKQISLSGLPRGELEALAERLLAENAALRRAIAELKAEVAALKGVKGRPKVKPSGMEKATEPTPAGITGHFGPELRRFVLAQYHQGWVTVPRLVAQLRAIGVLISKRQLVRLLNAGQDAFLDEAREVLRAGLSAAPWISVDDTGARHRHRNGVCTQLGNGHFAAFATTASKSRLNFLEVLRAGFTDYVINAEALAYMRRRSLAGPVIASLAQHPEHHFADEAAWSAHLERLGITALTVPPDPV